jgi:hypothetical protein
LKEQQSLPTSVKMVKKLLAPHWMGNFIDLVAFSFARKAVLSVVVTLDRL